MVKAYYGGPKKRNRSQRGSSEIAQFIPAVYILFLLSFFPLINIGALFIAAATQYLATNDFAAKASAQPDYSTALNTMASEALLFQSFGLSRFISLVPQGGYVGCGDDLYVVTTNIASGSVTTSGADVPLTQPIDTGSSMYEISVKSTYNVSPLINLSQLPVLGDVPGLGKPVCLTFTANRPVEHPSGLVSGGTGNSGSSGTVTPFNRIVVGGSTTTNPAVANNTWRTPTIFQQIQAAGQTVVNVSVVLVDPNNPNWTPSGVSVSPGQKIWLDTQAVGMWSSPGLAAYDANGIPGTVGSDGDECATANFAALVGVVGVTGPIQRNTANSFLLGDNQYNLAPPGGSGTFSMAYNDWDFGGCTGAQLVRVIVVQ